MNLNEFTTKELEIIDEMLRTRLDHKRKMLSNSRLDSFRDRFKRQIAEYELMRVKVNNALGKFGD